MLLEVLTIAVHVVVIELHHSRLIMVNNLIQLINGSIGSDSFFIMAAVKGRYL